MNLYVGNLSWGMTEDQLQELFSQFGAIASMKLVTDKFTGRSKGYAFVEMADRTAGQAAIDELNGKDVQGREITVNEARPREERPAFRSGGGFQGGRGGDRGGYNRGGGDRGGFNRGGGDRYERGGGRRYERDDDRW